MFANDGNYKHPIFICHYFVSLWKWEFSILIQPQSPILESLCILQEFFQTHLDRFLQHANLWLNWNKNKWSKNCLMHPKTSNVRLTFPDSLSNSKLPRVTVFHLTLNSNCKIHLYFRDFSIMKNMSIIYIYYFISIKD